MTHYHITTAKNFIHPIASVVYENYEDSLLAYVALSTEFFADIVEPGQLAIENAKAATGNGDAFGAYVGNDQICFFWLRCEEKCANGTWN